MASPVSRARASLPFLVLAAVCALGVAVLWAQQGGPDWTSPHAIDAIIGFGEVIVGVLGIAITVVAILVELAANRYTPRIVGLFLKDRASTWFLFFLVATSLMILWIELSLGQGSRPPPFMVISAAILMSLSLLLLLPYFAYVFTFLTPSRVISTIRDRAISGVDAAARRGELVSGREELLGGVEELGELSLNAVQTKDKGIAIEAIDALSLIAIAHLERKRELPARWFDSTKLADEDQDFIALHPQMVAALGERRTWAEMKVLRQYQAALPTTLNHMHDVAHLIGIRSRRIAEVAIAQRDTHAVELCLRFFNTYLRATINARDVRSTYNLLNEYRGVGELLLEREQDEEQFVELAERFKYYGQVAFNAKLAFLQETVAYDLSRLLQLAHERGSGAHDRVLAILLELDREPDSDGGHQEASLRGVRKAQSKLAAYYLSRKDRVAAHKIYEDMAGEKRARLDGIRVELLEVKQAEYWEVTDRGINFDYLEPDQRRYLEQFFGWFEGTPTLS